MRTVIVLRPGRSRPSGSSKTCGLRPAVGSTAAALTPVPLIQTSAMLPTRPKRSVADPVRPAGHSTSRVNQITPSNAGSPRDSQLPGTSIGFQSAARAAWAGWRQSGRAPRSRSMIGNPSIGRACGSARYSVRNDALWRVPAM
jgi:hypothetical protein